MITRFSNTTHTNIRTLDKNLKIKNNQSNPNFKSIGALGAQAGALGTQFLNFLNTSPAIGACFVDFGFMVTPRTAVDLGRSLDAGLETGFRESTGTINHASVGVVGLGAGYAVSAAYNKAHGIKAHRVFANSETIDTFKNFITSSETVNGYNTRKYWTDFFSSIKGFNTTETGNVWKSIDNSVVDQNGKTALTRVVDIMVEAGEKDYKVPKESMAKIMQEITGSTGAGSTFKVELNNVATKVEGSLENLVSNAYAMKKVVTDKASHDGTAVVQNLEKFLHSLKNKKLATVAAGLAIPLTIGIGAQPFNRYLTKKRTGSDGFVGVEGREPDKSTKFKLIKSGIAIAMGSAMVSTMLKRPADLYTNIKKAVPEIISKLQYTGIVPTLDQFKFIYGLTITSRIFSARDKNELRESSIKDSLGFANWLILGGFVSKLASKAFNKGIVNYDEATHGKGIWNYITKSVEKTHEEILYPTLKKMGISIIAEDGKKLPFRKLLATMKNSATGTQFEALAKETATKIRYKNYAQLLGYLYSGLVLGVGIPKLNIAITKHCEKKAASQKAQSFGQNNQTKVNNNFVIIQQQKNETFKDFLKQM